MTVEHDAHRRAVPEPRQAAGQLRVVGQHRAGADQHRVMLGAQQVRRSRAAGPVIQRLSPLAVAIRPSSEVASFRVTSGRPSLTRQKAGVELGRLGGAEPGLDRDAGLAQPADPGAGDARVGIFERGDDAAMPAAISASAQGGVCPQWLHGSRVT